MKNYKNFKRLLSLSIILAIILSLFTGCNGKSDSEDTINIAVTGPMTGDNAEYGNGFVNAAKMKANEYNENGGILGKKIKIISYDDKGTGEEAANVAQKIVSDESIVGVIGHFSSGACMAASPTYQEYGLVEISPSASHPDYTKEGDCIFRNNTVIVKEAKEAISLAANNFGKKKIGVLAIKTDWGTSTANVVKDIIAKDYKSQGIKLVLTEEVVEGSDDYTPNITKLKNAGAEVIVCCSMYNTLAPFAKQYKQTDPNIEIVGFSNAYSQQLIELGGKSVEGVVFPTIFFHESQEENIKNFVDKYAEKYGSTPSSLTAQAYDSVGILVEAIKEAGTSTDRKAIKKAVSQSSYKGVTGLTKFDKNRDAVKNFKHAKVQDGRFVEMKK